MSVISKIAIPQKRASYLDAVQWIAWNDEEEVLDRREVAGFISTCLVADLFGITPMEVAKDVIALREEEA